MEQLENDKKVTGQIKKSYPAKEDKKNKLNDKIIAKKGEIMKKALVYEYKTIKTKRELETMTCDVYFNLGWKLTSSKMADASLFYVNLSFKREKRINKIVGLLDVEQELIALLATIDTLQTKKKNAGKVGGITLATIGTLTFGGGLSLCLLKTTLKAIIGGSVLAIAGIGIGLLGLLVFKKVNAKQEQKLIPQIEGKMDKLSELCEKSGLLISKE